MRILLRIVPVAMLSVLALTACDDDAAPSSPASLGPGLIQEALNRSLESTVTIAATVSYGGPADISISGLVDPASGTLRISMTGPSATELIGMGGTLYVQTTGPNGEPWMRVDLVRLRPDSQLRGGLDIKGQAGIVAGIVSVEQTGPGSYRGVADLNAAAAAADESQRAALMQAAAAAQNASAVPYEAALDEQGRLTRLRYTIESGSGSMETELLLSRFGEPVQVEAPPESEVWDATDDLYAIL